MEAYLVIGVLMFMASLLFCKSLLECVQIGTVDDATGVCLPDNRPEPRGVMDEDGHAAAQCFDGETGEAIAPRRQQHHIRTRKKRRHGVIITEQSQRAKDPFRGVGCRFVGHLQCPDMEQDKGGKRLFEPFEVRKDPIEAFFVDHATTDADDKCVSMNPE